MRRFEPNVIIGLLIGVVAIGAGVLLEGIKLRFLWQPTAALVVLGGTLGAVTVRCGLAGLRTLVRETTRLFLAEHTQNDSAVISQLAWLARTAKREGTKVYERFASGSDDRLITTGLSLAAEFADPQMVRRSLDAVLEDEDRHGRTHATLLESAGGYAPTFGILGAVLGLIHVLRSLDDPGKLGLGIATAFVATIYGVGIANLLFFPLAAKLRERHESMMRRREMLADALVAVSAQKSPGEIKRSYSQQQTLATGTTVRDLYHVQ
ncbi:MAG TPA: MotA/TolQ/ExbB proton channel family protein [Pyrinomonadaceae bacterium]|nr:MotA/TolQ/ExbB proton channel family protein [Pyrinomonadaceae bacterium]